VFLDILVHTNGKWYAYEVKSSKKISETYIKDAAIQYYVIKASGLAIADFSIIYLNENYDYALANAEEWDIHELFNEQSVLQEILDLQPYIQETVQNAKATLESDEIPIIEMGDHCDFPYTCDFKGFCKKT
jgi:CRISPR/Cas system-associated exonuclease Cas4 (RecB family)